MLVGIWPLREERGCPRRFHCSNQQRLVNVSMLNLGKIGLTRAPKKCFTLYGNRVTRIQRAGSWPWSRTISWNGSTPCRCSYSSCLIQAMKGINESKEYTILSSNAIEIVSWCLTLEHKHLPHPINYKMNHIPAMKKPFT
ncbi:hypothetical protein GIB67_031555, partial [Kingdonia uniflora]